jgi:hypothetical protein
MSTSNRKALSVVIVAAVVFLIGYILVTSGLGIDFSNAQTRSQAANRDANIALQFAFTGESDTSKTAQDQVIDSKVSSTFKSQLEDQVQKTFTDNIKVADSAKYGIKLFHKTQVLESLDQKYVNTVLTPKDYSVEKINYDQYHNVTVSYLVKPLDVNAVQEKMQTSVNQQVDNFYGDNDKPSAEKMSLIQLGLMDSNWDKLIKQNTLKFGKQVTGQFKMNFNKNWRNPYYSIDKGDLTLLTNSGILSSQKGD